MYYKYYFFDIHNKAIKYHSWFMGIKEIKTRGSKGGKKKPDNF